MRVVTFGAGRWGQNYIRELSGYLVGVVEPDAATATEVANKFNVPVWPELPNGLRFDAAVICTPPQYHVPIALPLLQAGKYVLVEKPLATNVEEAALLAGYERAMVGHIYRYHPGVEALKEWASTHPVDHMYCRRTNQGPIRPWQDVTWDLATHDVSVALHCFGFPTEVAVTGTRDWSILRLTFPTTNAIIYTSWLGGPKIRSIELVPAGGGERYIFDDMAAVLEVSPLRRMLDAFLSGSWDRCTVKEGFDVVRVLQAATR